MQIQTQHIVESKKERRCSMGYNANRDYSVNQRIREIIERGAKWRRVRYNECTGYSAAQYISVGENKQPQSGYAGVCTGDGVRVRKEPGFGDNIIRHLNKGNLFDGLEVSGVWTRINVQGIEGYIYSDYVKKA